MFQTTNQQGILFMAQLFFWPKNMDNSWITHSNSRVPVTSRGRSSVGIKLSMCSHAAKRWSRSHDCHVDVMCFIITRITRNKKVSSILWLLNWMLLLWIIMNPIIVSSQYNELNVIFVIIYTGIHNDSFVFSSDIQSMNVYIYGGFLK